jgi:hypothetical protein
MSIAGIGRILIALCGLVALIAGVVAIWYVVGFAVLRLVGLLLPLTGRKTRRKDGRCKSPGTP